MTSPRVYVGTYAKYNAGNLAGAWLSVDDYVDSYDFYKAAKELHSDECDDELMFQDHENRPEGLIGEFWIDENVWTYIEASDEEKEIFNIYRKAVGSEDDITAVLEAFQGVYRSPEDWAIQYFEDCMEVPQHLENYIDYSAFARDAGIDSVHFVEVGWDRTFVFSRF